MASFINTFIRSARTSTNLFVFFFWLTDINRKTSLDSTSSSQFSDIDFSETYDDIAASVASKHGHTISMSEDDCDEIVKRILHQKKPIRITLKLHVTEATFSVWDTVLNPENNILYVALPTILLPEASKQSFITLLEFAEEKLDVDAVVLCMRKDRSDRQHLVRTFLFLGFQPLSAKSQLAPPQTSNDNNLFLIYKIEDD